METRQFREPIIRISESVISDAELLSATRPNSDKSIDKIKAALAEVVAGKR